MTLVKFGKMKTSNKHSTIIYVFCMYCNKFFGTKNGKGIYGTTHAVCEKCLEKNIAG